MTAPPKCPHLHVVRYSLLGQIAFLAATTIILAVLFYLEENLRGAHVLAATKERWEARGESFDDAKFIPPVVPDDQNLAALPLFQVGDGNGADHDSAGLPNLRRALHHLDDPNTPNSSMALPPTGNWLHGDLIDMAQFRDIIARDYALVFNGQPPPADAMAQFDALFPFTAELRAAAATRPEFRLNCAYGTNPPADRPLLPLNEPIQLARVMALHATLALDHGRPEVALDDLRVNEIMLAGIARDPSWFGGLVSVSINAISTSAVFHGLALRQWPDAQLAGIERLYAQRDFLAGARHALRAEALEDIATFRFYKTQWRHGVPGLSGLIPGGWWDLNAAHAADFFLGDAMAADPAAHRFSVNVANAAATRAEELRPDDDSVAPWMMWAMEAEPITKGLHLFPQAQVWTDQTRIACALERHRLARGVYPDALDALAPAFIDAVPRDVMNGQPYRYQLKPDGAYTLYSVGWDQIDNQGDVFWETSDPEVEDYARGDWAWPMVKR